MWQNPKGLGDGSVFGPKEVGSAFGPKKVGSASEPKRVGGRVRVRTQRGWGMGSSSDLRRLGLCPNPRGGVLGGTQAAWGLGLWHDLKGLGVGRVRTQRSWG